MTRPNPNAGWRRSQLATLVARGGIAATDEDSSGPARTSVRQSRCQIGRQPARGWLVTDGIVSVLCSTSLSSAVGVLSARCTKGTMVRYPDCRMRLKPTPAGLERRAATSSLQPVSLAARCSAMIDELLWMREHRAQAKPSHGTRFRLRNRFREGDTGGEVGPARCPAAVHRCRRALRRSPPSVGPGGGSRR